MQLIKGWPFLCAALASSATAQSFMGEEVFKQTFTISGGKTIELPVSKRGPLPATADGATVMACGPLFGPSKTSPGNLEAVWAISVATPKGEKYQMVAVDDVTGAAETALVSKKDLSPEQMTAPDGKQFHILQLRGEGMPVTEKNTPWLYHDKTDMFIFRVTLKGDSGTPTTLYQPCVVPASAKAKIREIAQRVSEKK